MSKYDEIRKQFYKEYDEEELQDVLYKLRTTNMVSIDNFDDIGVDTIPITSHWFDRILYKAKRINNTMSPAEAVESDECLDKIFEYIKTKPKFYKGSDVNNLKTYFRNSQTSVVNASKVANFSPITARKIYERFCPQFNATILDYSCGFGARMLGCLSSPFNYKYVGIEPNSELNDQLGKFSEWVCNSLHRDNNTVLYKTGSEVFHEELVNSVDLSFSSPPYFNLEIYTDEETQSASKTTAYSDWLKYYMIPTIQNIYQYTKVGGLHIVNLKNIDDKHPCLQNWINVCKGVGFEIVYTDFIRHQSRRQFDKGKEHSNFNADKEYIVVFKKVS